MTDTAFIHEQLCLCVTIFGTGITHWWSFSLTCKFCKVHTTAFISILNPCACHQSNYSRCSAVISRQQYVDISVGWFVCTPSMINQEYKSGWRVRKAFHTAKFLPAHYVETKLKHGSFMLRQWNTTFCSFDRFRKGLFTQ